MTELADVRLVYAPPRAVGEFGGEIDNWSWPRHTGDFSIGRAYVDGKPYRPEFFFPISTKGVQPGDFVMVLGYPGITFRALTADEMEERHRWFSARASVYRDWIRILETNTKGQPAGEIAVADLVKTLANRQKNGEGQLAGFKRGRILEKQRAADRAVLAAYPNAQASLRRSWRPWRPRRRRRSITTSSSITSACHRNALTPTGPKSLVMAFTIAKAALERQKPDAERDPAFMQRVVAACASAWSASRRTSSPPRTRRCSPISFAARKALPDDQHIAALDGIASIDDLYAQHEAARSRRASEDVRRDAGTAPGAERSARRPRLRAGRRDSRRCRSARTAGTERCCVCVPYWRRAVIAHAGKPVAPDANSTLRVSFAHVQGYAPRDGDAHGTADHAARHRSRSTRTPSRSTSRTKCWPPRTGDGARRCR